MPVESWLEVSLVVEDELAEAVAEVLARFAPGGVAIEATAVVSEVDNEAGRPAGPLRVVAYLPLDKQIEATRQRLEEALWHLGRIQPLPAPQYRLVQEQDWAEAWKQHYQPIAIGQRLIVVPAWLENPDPSRVAVRMDPGMAFGTGTHPTTQLCLEWIERILSGGFAGAPPEVHSLIDVGCGSGILAIAALKLGAQRALGVDVDAQAVAIARQNAELNGVAERLILGVGSVAEIRQGKFALQQAPLVVANILAPIIVQLLDDGLAHLLTPGGLLVLSGIIAEQVPEVEAALLKHARRVIACSQSGDWVALVAG